MDDKVAKTVRLSPETIVMIEKISKQYGISQQAAIARAVWYLAALEGPDGVLAVAFDKIIMEKLPAMVDQKIACQNKALEIMLEAMENRIIAKCNQKQINRI